jgi:hypothetical protein
MRMLEADEVRGYFEAVVEDVGGKYGSACRAEEESLRLGSGSTISASNRRHAKMVSHPPSRTGR